MGVCVGDVTRGLAAGGVNQSVVAGARGHVVYTSRFGALCAPLAATLLTHGMHAVSW